MLHRRKQVRLRDAFVLGVGLELGILAVNALLVAGLRWLLEPGED